MNPEWFAGRLRELRSAAGLSRQQLADQAGMKLGGIRDLEQGVRSPSWETVLAICQAPGAGCDSLPQPPAENLPPAASGRPKKAAETPVAAAPKKKPGRKGKGK